MSAEADNLGFVISSFLGSGSGEGEERGDEGVGDDEVILGD